MPITNTLLENSGKASLRGIDVNPPDYMFWAGSDNTFTGAETEVINDYFHKGVVWIGEGIDSVFSVELSPGEAVGSYINTYGLINNATVGSGTPLLILPSDIGVKTANFVVEIEGKILYRRPT